MSGFPERESDMALQDSCLTACTRQKHLANYAHLRVRFTYLTTYFFLFTI